MNARRPPTIRVLDVPVHALRMDDVLAHARRAIATRDPLLIAVVNAAKLVNMRRDPLLRRSVLAADLTLADGMAVVWAARLLGLRLPERVTGIDLMLRLLAQADGAGQSVFFLGARPDVLAEVVARTQREFPGVRIAGAADGYFAAGDEPALAARIAAAAPDLLFVAMTSPRKEQFLARWHAQLRAAVCHGVGGAFDVFAGRVRRAPLRWQRCGCEWLYRVLQEPRRMWRRYLVTNSLFGALLLRDLVRRNFARRHARSAVLTGGQ